MVLMRDTIFSVICELPNAANEKYKLAKLDCYHDSVLLNGVFQPPRHEGTKLKFITRPVEAGRSGEFYLTQTD